MGASQEELMARFMRRSDFNPETGRLEAPAAPAASPMKLVGGSFGGGFGGINTPTSIPTTDTVTTGSSKAPAADGRAAAQFGAGKIPRTAPDLSFVDAVDASITGANFSKGLTPTGNALSVKPVTDTQTASKLMGNITGVDKSVSPNPYRISADNEADVVGADFSKGVYPTGNALNFTPVTDNPTASKPMGNMSTAIQSSPVDEKKALDLFTKLHGSGGFNAKSSKDLAKMDAIKALMKQEGSDKLSDKQFAMRIYSTQGIKTKPTRK